jgi:flavin-dependent dehydrogenase
MIGVQRQRLDAQLLDYAKSFGSVQTYLGSAVRSLDVDSQGVFSVTTSTFKIRSVYLVIADGGSSTSLLRLGRAPRKATNARLGSSSLWGIKDGVVPSVVTTVIRPEGEVYITPVADDAVNSQSWVQNGL